MSLEYADVSFQYLGLSLKYVGVSFNYLYVSLEYVDVSFQYLDLSLIYVGVSFKHLGVFPHSPPAVSWCVPHQEECAARPSTLSNGQTAHTCSQTEKFDFVQTGREYDCVTLSLDFVCAQNN